MENFDSGQKTLTPDKISYSGSCLLNERALLKKAIKTQKEPEDSAIVYECIITTILIYFNMIKRHLVEAYIFLVNKANISDSLDMPKCSETTS